MLFGTSGIRGIYGKDVNEQMAMKIANIFAEKEVVVARDTRTTSEALAFAALSGIIGKGCDSIYLGIAPTPTLALITKNRDCRGIMITASHNPPEYNGLKFYESGKEISRKAELELESRYNKEGLRFSAWDETGKLSEYRNAISDHKKAIKSLLDLAPKHRMPKVVVDSNGPGALITPSLLKELGCEVISINDSLHGFTREPEPNQQSLQELARKVKQEGADLGIGHDGDADRSVIVDERGEMLQLDVQLAMMIDHEIEKYLEQLKDKPSARAIKVVTTVEASLCVREAIKNAGAEPIITRVGSLYVSEMLEKQGAIFGGEPCGEYIFADHIHVPDGILSAAKFVELFVKKGKLSELKKKYNVYEMAREKFKCTSMNKYDLVRKIAKEITITGKRNQEDGIRVDEEDGWFLIRASGTEPYIRLTAEYKNRSKLNQRVKELRELVLRYL